MYLTDGDRLRHLASKGPSPDPVSHVDWLPINRESLTGRSVLERKTIQLPDLLTAGDEYPLSHEIAARQGHRTVVVTPLLREGQPFGAILLRRQEVRPFSDREITLLTTFGDQAAIALENVRLFNETKEALDQQRASGEVLAAISNSIADTTPVFDKILSSCEHLFAGRIVGINVVGEDGLNRLAGYHGAGREEIERTFPAPIDAQTGTGIAIMQRNIVHLPDIDGGAAVPPITRRRCQAMGIKAVVIAPMLWEGKGIGTIFVGRDYAGPFSDKDIALLRTFADQAVIAIQNARLFNETKEALDQQRASGEVLSAISSSIADTTPVFDKILASCERLFAGKIAQINVVADDGSVRLGAYHGPGREAMERLFPIPVDETSATGVAILRRMTLHFADVDHDAGVPPRARPGWQAMGIKSIIGAPMLWEGKGVGAIFVGRDYVGPFSGKDIALLQTFANQAVIAIQNARLFHENKEEIHQQQDANHLNSEII
jgi:GAF domain-containing protein